MLTKLCIAIQSIGTRSAIEAVEYLLEKRVNVNRKEIWILLVLKSGSVIRCYKLVAFISKALYKRTPIKYFSNIVICLYMMQDHIFSFY